MWKDYYCGSSRAHLGYLPNLYKTRILILLSPCPQMPPPPPPQKVVMSGCWCCLGCFHHTFHIWPILPFSLILQKLLLFSFYISYMAYPPVLTDISDILMINIPSSTILAGFVCKNNFTKGEPNIHRIG